jgi:hypothetical protein
MSSGMLQKSPTSVSWILALRMVGHVSGKNSNGVQNVRADWLVGLISMMCFISLASDDEKKRFGIVPPRTLTATSRRTAGPALDEQTIIGKASSGYKRRDQGMAAFMTTGQKDPSTLV